MSLNALPYKWDLREDVCPCDIHFNEWVAVHRLRRKTIYHFGSGAHHVVGMTQAERKNQTLSITASDEEHQAYARLVADNPRLARHYICYFGDIYLTNPALLPDFDVVTLFHLCEFFYSNTASKEYGGLTDRKVLDLFTDKTRKGGHILFYTKSMAFDRAKPMIERWERARPVRRVGEFKTLLVYEKRR
jgi:hypothetical protein